MEQPSPRVEVRRSTRRRRTVTAFRERDTIVVVVPHRMSKVDERAFVDDMVRRVLAREARQAPPQGDRDLTTRAVELSERYLKPTLGTAPLPAAVSWVGNQNQRWGSCTPSARTIRLSDRLQQLPGWVVDYVLLHELTHLVEPTHSAEFWSLVGGYPRAERARGFLEGYQSGQGRPADPDADAD